MAPLKTLSFYKFFDIRTQMVGQLMKKKVEKEEKQETVV